MKLQLIAIETQEPNEATDTECNIEATDTECNIVGYIVILYNKLKKSLRRYKLNIGIFEHLLKNYY